MNHSTRNFPDRKDFAHKRSSHITCPEMKPVIFILLTGAPCPEQPVAMLGPCMILHLETMKADLELISNLITKYVCEETRRLICFLQRCWKLAEDIKRKA